MRDPKISSTIADKVQQLVEINQKLTALQWIAAQIATEQDLNTLYNLINNGFKEITGVAKCGFYLIDEAYTFKELATSMMGNNDPYWHCKGTIEAVREALQNKRNVIPVQDKHCVFCKERQNCPSITLLLYALYDRNGRAKAVLIAYDTDNTVIKDEYLKILELFTLQVSLALENAELAEQLRNLAITDGLTGLFNHRYFMECLIKKINYCRKNNSFFSLLMIDVDEFKSYNDKFGHVAGDSVLRKLGMILSHKVENIGQAFRYGGEEFTVILPGYPYAEAYKVAEDIRRSIALTYFGYRKITVSIGLAQYPIHALDYEELIEFADKGLYLAKSSGKNQVCFFD